MDDISVMQTRDKIIVMIVMPPPRLLTRSKNNLGVSQI